VRSAQKEVSGAFRAPKLRDARSSTPELLRAGSSHDPFAIENGDAIAATVDDDIDGQAALGRSGSQFVQPVALTMASISSGQDPLAVGLRRATPVRRPTWEQSLFDEQGALLDVLSLKQAIFDGGLAPDVRELAWPFLLRVFPWSSTRSERRNIVENLVTEYRALTRKWSAALVAMAQRGESLDGILGSVDIEELERRLSTLTDEELAEDSQLLAQTANVDLLGLTMEGESSSTVSVANAGESGVKGSDVSSRGARSEKQREEERHVREIRSQIIKDVVRTDRGVDAFADGDVRTNPLLGVMERILSAYAMKNQTIGYCQGMSDFLSPLIYAFFVQNGASRDELGAPNTMNGGVDTNEQAEALLFGCFSQLMRRVGGNFMQDQSGIRTQLSAVRGLVRVADRDLFKFYEMTDPSFYSVYRWLLVHFKREVAYGSVSRLWELFWLDHVAPGELHLYVVVALLCSQRDQILQLPEGEFDQILRFVNSMAKRFDVAAAAHLAARLYLRVGRVRGEESAPDAALDDEAVSPATLHLLF